MKKVIQLNPVFEEPMIASGTKTLNGSAIIIKNAGDDDCVLNYTFTLSPGESITFGTATDENVIVLNLNLRFAGVGVNPRVEFLQLKVAEEGYSNYIQK